MHILGFAYIQIRVLSIHAKMVVTVRPMALEDTVVNVLRELEEKTAQKVHKLVYLYSNDFCLIYPYLSNLF